MNFFSIQSKMLLLTKYPISKNLINISSEPRWVLQKQRNTYRRNINTQERKLNKPQPSIPSTWVWFALPSKWTEEKNCSTQRQSSLPEVPLRRLHRHTCSWDTCLSRSLWPPPEFAGPALGWVPTPGQWGHRPASTGSGGWCVRWPGACRPESSRIQSEQHRPCCSRSWQWASPAPEWGWDGQTLAFWDGRGRTEKDETY